MIGHKTGHLVSRAVVILTTDGIVITRASIYTITIIYTYICVYI